MRLWQIILNIPDYIQETVVTGLIKPAGIDVIDNRMIISEYQTGEIIIYDITSLPALELERINTGLSSVQGIKIGPEGRIWFVDKNSNGVYKIETADLGIEEIDLNATVYPNPSSGIVNVLLDYPVDGDIEVTDVQGQVIHCSKISGQSTTIDIKAEPGIYFISVAGNGFRSALNRIVVQ